MVLEGMDNPPSYEDSLKHAASQASRARTWATRNNFFLNGGNVGQSRAGCHFTQERGTRFPDWLQISQTVLKKIRNFNVVSD